MSISPESALIKCIIRLRIDVFPEPEGPFRTTFSPLSIFSERSSNTFFPLKTQFNIL
jgi:hypothetical protein